MKPPSQARRIGIASAGLALGLLLVASAQVLPPGMLSSPSNHYSPVAHFRSLLAMDAEDQESALQTKRPDQAEILRRKIEEYRRMPAPERDLRLRQVELCRLILPLMDLSAEERLASWPRLPEREERIVRARLAEWDRLTEEQQRHVRTDRTILSFFFRPDQEFVRRQFQRMQIVPPQLRQKLQTELAQWRGNSLAERELMHMRLNQLLKLKQKEQDRVLRHYSQVDFDQLKSTLRIFQSLSPDQRQKCLEGFGRLANLSETERDQFIFDVRRWQAMTPTQKHLWKLIVERLETASDPKPNPLDARVAPLDRQPGMAFFPAKLP